MTICVSYTYNFCFCLCGTAWSAIGFCDDSPPKPTSSIPAGSFFFFPTNPIFNVYGSAQLGSVAKWIQNWNVRLCRGLNVRGSFSNRQIEWEGVRRSETANETIEMNTKFFFHLNEICLAFNQQKKAAAATEKKRNETIFYINIVRARTHKEAQKMIRQAICQFVWETNRILNFRHNEFHWISFSFPFVKILEKSIMVFIGNCFGSLNLPQKIELN